MGNLAMYILQTNFPE